MSGNDSFRCTHQTSAFQRLDKIPCDRGERQLPSDPAEGTLVWKQVDRLLLHLIIDLYVPLCCGQLLMPSKLHDDFR